MMEEIRVRIALCDDNKDWLDTEVQYINYINDSSLAFDTFSSGEELINKYKSCGCIYDAVLLDMEMNHLDGINTANIIRLMDRCVLIVFVTSHKKYMQKSFECLPFRFLLKPIDFNEFKDIILKLINAVEEDKQALVFNEGRDVIRLLYEEIIFIQSIDHRICIKTVDKVYQTYTFNMSDIQSKLSDNRFVKVHKSYIINISHIQKIASKNVIMRGYNHEIPIGNPYKNELKRRVMLFEERKHLS